MCENCTETIDRCWTEIRDLLNYRRKLRGPLAQTFHDEVTRQIEAAQESFDETGANFEISDAHRQTIEDHLRAEMISIRCAVIAHYLHNSPMTGAPFSAILAHWAAETLRVEICSDKAERLENLLYVPGMDREEAE